MEEEIQVRINGELERRIADAFDAFDHGGAGRVDVREVGTILRGLGCYPSEAEVLETIVRLEDPATPGTVRLSTCLPHLVRLITERKFQPASAERLVRAFRALDAEESGSVDGERFAALMGECGEPFARAEIEEMFAAAAAAAALDSRRSRLLYDYYINQLMDV